VFLTLLINAAHVWKADAKVGHSRVTELREAIHVGKSNHHIADRDIHQYWEEFDNKLDQFNATFEDLICTNPDDLRAIHSEMNNSIEMVRFSWYLKQEQLMVLYNALHHENYTDTALANEEVGELCSGLNEYIIMANETAQEEKIELDSHLQFIFDLQTMMDIEPCPCVWGDWSEWSDCSTTCGTELQQRVRVIVKEAINGGMECQGESSEQRYCNEITCCPVDCIWGEWEDWPACPSGCPVGGGLQEKTRTRIIVVEASCNGTECAGNDFETEHCSREDEVLILHAELLDLYETVVQERDQLTDDVEELNNDIEECQSDLATSIQTGVK